MKKKWVTALIVVVVLAGPDLGSRIYWSAASILQVSSKACMADDDIKNLSQKPRNHFFIFKNLRFLNIKK